MTISENSAEYGGGIYNGSSSPILTNVIIWRNRAYTTPSISNFRSTPVISHSIIEGSGGSASWDSYLGTDSGANLDTDPLFVKVFTSNFHLKINSPAIDTGDNSVVSGVTTDLDGNSRIANGTVDMGAYEYGAIPLQNTLIFTPLQDTYYVGDVLTLSLETQIITGQSFETADLWVAIEMPNSDFLFLTAMPFEPFSRTPQPFMASVENVADIYSI